MSEFDRDIKVGDVITSYHKGIHKVCKVERRFYTKDDEYRNYGKEGEEYSSLIHYHVLTDSNGNERKNAGKSKSCDAGFCKLMTKERVEEDYQKTVEAADKIRKTILKFL